MEVILEYKSSAFDKLLLFLAVVSIFFEPYLPFFRGTSTAFFVFTFIMGYVLFTRLKAFRKIVSSIYFIVVILFTAICVLMESIHSYPDYVYIFRFLNMSMGMFCISVLCRDKEAIDVTIYSFIFCSAGHSVYMMLGPMNFLRSLSAHGFDEASKARIQAFEQFTIHDHLNDISIFSGLGALLGIITWVYERSRIKRGILVALIMLAVVGIFLPASRTGALVFFVSLGIFLYKSKMKVKKWLLPLAIFGVLLFLVVPEVVWERISSIGRMSELKEVDSRAKMYTAILDILQKYMLTGVGCGYYWKQWAVDNGLTNIMDVYEPLAPHNAFFQVWIYWGLPAFLTFIYMMYVFSRALDKHIVNHRQKASLYIFILIIPIVFLFYPRFYHKAFSVGVGIMLAARFWNIFGTQLEEHASDPEQSPMEITA
jgi:O-antigen ligase